MPSTLKIVPILYYTALPFPSYVCPNPPKMSARGGLTRTIYPLLLEGEGQGSRVVPVIHPCLRQCPPPAALQQLLHEAVEHGVVERVLQVEEADVAPVSLVEPLEALHQHHPVQPEDEEQPEEDGVEDANEGRRHAHDCVLEHHEVTEDVECTPTHIRRSQ